jgi:pimeloyl-ACP methyl ester carboxylesterase
MPVRRAVPRTLAAAALLAAVACSQDPNDTSSNPDPDSPDQETHMTTSPTGADVREISVRGTTFHVTERGSGPPLLLVHGGGEDSTMLEGQAASLADRGYRVISYDRRGTGQSGRDAWPGSGGAQHADDAAAVLAALDAQPATVVGVSSGGVVAMAVAARHPDLVERVVAWEPPALGVLPGSDELNAQVMAPVEDYLARHPGDYVGAQALLLSMVLGFEVSVDDPDFAPARANAEPFIRDEPTITLQTFDQKDLRDVRLTVAVGGNPHDIVAGAAARLAHLSGQETVRVRNADHEVYLEEPDVLTRVVVSSDLA